VILTKICGQNTLVESRI